MYSNRAEIVLMGQRCRDFALEHLSMSSMAKQYLTLLEGLLHTIAVAKK